jgi:glyoxylase-like metal-dependent hydrolase (beta-lactamase superfamily II)
LERFDLNYRRVVVGDLETNCYILWDDSKDVVLIIDPGAQVAKICEILSEKELTPTEIVLTHSHYDHICAAPELKETFGIPISIHADDAENLKKSTSNFSAVFGEDVEFEADRILHEGDIWSFGDEYLKVLHTPGHSEGSISLVSNQIILTGDTVFKCGIGRNDLPGGNYGCLRESIGRLLTFPDETVLFPGHGPRTTIGDERIFLSEI